MTQSPRLVRTIAPEVVQQVMDIGVQVKTDLLMAVFPDRQHKLFEPSLPYHDQLEENYQKAGIDYRLHRIALSDSDGLAYLHETSVDGSGGAQKGPVRPGKAACSSG